MLISGLESFSQSISDIKYADCETVVVTKKEVTAFFDIIFDMIIELDNYHEQQENNIVKLISGDIKRDKRKTLNEFKNDDKITYLLKYQDKYIGFCTFTPVLNDKNKIIGCNFDFFYIKDEYRGKGLGRYFFQDSIQRIQKDIKNIKFITTSVVYDNGPARYLYEDNGFKPYHISLIKQL